MQNCDEHRKHLLEYVLNWSDLKYHCPCCQPLSKATYNVAFHFAYRFWFWRWKLIMTIMKEGAFNKLFKSKVKYMGKVLSWECSRDYLHGYSIIFTFLFWKQYWEKRSEISLHCYKPPYFFICKLLCFSYCLGSCVKKWNGNLNSYEGKKNFFLNF